MRTITSLSAGALTLLVALGGSYIGDASPLAIMCLQESWTFFAISILSGIIALYGESQTYLESVQNLINSFSDFAKSYKKRKSLSHDVSANIFEQANKDLDEAAKEFHRKFDAGYPPRPVFQYFYLLMVLSFAIAIVTLFAFGSLKQFS